MKRILRTGYPGILTWKEQHRYGSSRLGLFRGVEPDDPGGPDDPAPSPDDPIRGESVQVAGDKLYEVSNYTDVG